MLPSSRFSSPPYLIAATMIATPSAATMSTANAGPRIGIIHGAAKQSSDPASVSAVAQPGILIGTSGEVEAQPNAIGGISREIPAPAYAGCVVLKNGEVLVGRIREEEVTTEQITMRWPYKTKTERGEIDIPRFRVRWFDREADEPTDAYWEEFGDTKIDSQWLVLYEKWKLRNKKDELGEGFEITPENFMSKASLSPIPVENGNFKIQKPEGWTSSIE